MMLDNGILKLELTNKGGEMASLLYREKEILYKGDGPYWSGKNPTLFPFISSPNAKQYVYDGITYPCRNHGLIRYSTLETIIDNGKEVTMKLASDENTLKEYPFNFEYYITYKLDNNKVIIEYSIVNKDTKEMPFTFGLHPGFIVKDFNSTSILLNDDEEGELFNQKTRTSSIVKLKEYKNFIEDVTKLETVIFKNLKSKKVTLKQEDYSITLDMSKFKYLALWTADPRSNYICVEPWLSINDIKPSNNPFDENFELVYLKPNEKYKIDYSIEIK